MMCNCAIDKISLLALVFHFCNNRFNNEDMAILLLPSLNPKLMER